MALCLNTRAAIAPRNKMLDFGAFPGLFEGMAEDLLGLMFIWAPVPARQVWWR